MTLWRTHLLPVVQNVTLREQPVEVNTHGKEESGEAGPRTH